MRARVVAPLVAGVLGLGGGVATAIVAAPDDGRGQVATEDPLRLGIPMVDQQCTGEALLVVAYGDSAAALGSAAAGLEERGARYLRSEDSCDTVLGPERKPTPAYTVYLGPFDNRRDPCEIRMSGEASGSFVTVLSSGNQQLVKCPCELPTDAGPVLRLGMPVDQESKLWIRGLQAMLNDFDGETFPHDAITGVYDPFTSARVREFQEAAPGKLTVKGVVDATTWGILTDRICRIYTY